MSEDTTTEQLMVAADRFPFVMLLTTYFLQGSLFLIFNGPLVIALIENQSFQTPLSIFQTGLLKSWMTALSSDAGLASLSALLLMALVAGILLTPIDRVIGILSCRVVEIMAVVTRRKSLKLFTSWRFLDTDYIPLVAWLLSARASKLHWEWELFLYHTYSSVLTNVILFAALALVQRWSTLDVVEAGAYLFVVLLFFSFSLSRSIFMARVHAYYLARFRAQRRQLPESVP